MRILFLVVLSVLSTSYQLFAQANLDSAASVGDIPVVDYNSSGRFVIKDISMTGINNLDPEILISTSGMSVGDTINIPGEYISDGIKKLWSQRYYSDIKVVVNELGADSIALNIVVTERPRVYNWDFEGAKKGEITSMMEKLKLRRGGELSDFSMKNSMDIITEHYKEKGFMNVAVSIKQENDPIIKNGVNVTFVVDRGEKIKIGEIVFEGNEEVSDKKLKGSFKKTKDKSLLNMFKSSKFNEENFAADKLYLIDYYNAHGFRNATVMSDTIYDINSKRIGIKISVDEGNKYYYRNISWMGNSKYTTEDLNNMVGIQTGDVYDRQTMMRRLGIGMDSSPDDMSVSSLYQNDGHIFFQVEPAESIIGADSIDVEFKILEGKQVRINEVSISGNARINDEIIRRDLYIKPGELYDRSLLMATLRQLSQMSHFNPEALQPDINPISDELVNIGFPLEEQASDKFELSGGWGSDTFVGSIGVQFNNLSLKNFFKKDAWRPYPSGQNQQFAITGQTNGTYYNSLQLSFSEPWLGGKKPNSLNVVAYISEENDAYYYYQDATMYFRTTGLSVGLGRRLSWPDRYFTLYNELSAKIYSLDDWEYFIMEDGTANVISFKTVLGRNSVDQSIYPRRGSSFSVSLELTPPYSLFDGKDYSDDDMEDSERYKWIEYHKWLTSAEWYYSMTSDQKLVLMAKAQFGSLGSYNSDKLSPFEGFDVGGDGLSGYSVYGVDVIGLRGYDDSALNPYSSTGDYARAYCKYTVELRYPVILQPASTVYGLVFAEGGNAYSDISSFNPFTIKRSVGAGIRMYLPIIGMVGIDWGYGIDYAVGESAKSGSHTHFVIGTQF